MCAHVTVLTVKASGPAALSDRAGGKTLGCLEGSQRRSPAEVSSRTPSEGRLTQSKPRSTDLVLAWVGEGLAAPGSPGPGALEARHGTR